jgi:hypothetical protein
VRRSQKKFAPPALPSGSVDLFYSYPVDVIASWCDVTVETAASWKCGVSRPSRQACKLFELHRDGRVFGGTEWDGWRVHGSRLFDPEGNGTTQGQLRAYAVAIRLLLELSRQGVKWSKIRPELVQVRELLVGSPSPNAREARSGRDSAEGRPARLPRLGRRS